MALKMIRKTKVKNMFVIHCDRLKHILLLNSSRIVYLIQAFLCSLTYRSFSINGLDKGLRLKYIFL